jgi:hypothetical protein
VPLRPSYPVHTARLLLRPLGREDTPALLEYRSLPEVCRWVPFEPMNAQTIAARLQGPWAATSLEAEGDVLTLGVEAATTGEVIGDVMLRWLSAEHSCGELGYVFHPAFAGQGYAAEAHMPSSTWLSMTWPCTASSPASMLAPWPRLEWRLDSACVRRRIWWRTSGSRASGVMNWTSACWNVSGWLSTVTGAPRGEVLQRSAGGGRALPFRGALQRDRAPPGPDG